MRRTLSTKMRLQIFTDASGCCHLCGVKIGVGERWEVEHVIALSLGGEDRPENMRPAHVACHKVKSAKDAADTARAVRRQAIHLGAKRQSSRPLPGGRNSPFRKKINGTVEPRT